MLKKGGGKAGVTRLMMNLTLANAVEMLMKGDLDALASASRSGSTSSRFSTSVVRHGLCPNSGKSMPFRRPAPGWYRGKPEQAEKFG